MSSQGEINPSELPTDSQDNASEDSFLYDSNSNATFCVSEDGFSGLNNDPNNDAVPNDEGNFQDESFINPSDNLTEDNLNSDSPFANEHYSSICRESTSHQYVSIQHLSNLSPLDKSAINIETPLNESLISKYETFTNASLPISSYMKGTEIEAASDKFQSINYDYTLEQEMDQNSIPISTDETQPLLPNYDSMQAGNPIYNSIHLISETDLKNSSQFSTNNESSFLENEEEMFTSNAYSSDQSSHLEEIFNSQGISVCPEANYFSGFLDESYLSQINIAGTLQQSDDASISEHGTSNLKLSDIKKISGKNNIYEKSLFSTSIEFFPVGIQNASQESNTNPTLKQYVKQINNFSKTTVLKETPLNETEAYQLKEIPQINSGSISYEDSYSANIGLSNSENSVPEAEKCGLKMIDVSEKIDTFNNKNVGTKCVSNPEDYRSSEQSILETTNLNSKNKSLDKELELEQKTCIPAENILPRNVIARTDNISGGENYLLNASDKSHENDFNLTIWPEFASNETNVDILKKVEVHGNYIETRNDCNNSSSANSSTEPLPHHLYYTEDSIRHKYQKLKNIINRYFESYEISSLYENQWKETLLEVAAVIGTTNIPLLSRNTSSMDKGIASDNYRDNPQSNNKPTADCKFEHQILNANENSATGISFPPVQDTVNSRLANKSNSRKEENTVVVSKTGVNNSKAYDFDNSNETFQNICPILNEFNCASDNFDTNKTELNFSLPKVYTLEEGENFRSSSKALEAGLEKEAHIPVDCQKNNNIHSITNTFLAETNNNSDFKEIFSTEWQNAASVSTSNLNSTQTGFVNITTDYRQKAALLENKGDNFAVQRSISDSEQTTEIRNAEENTQRNICSFISKQRSELKSSSANGISATQTCGKESNTTENCNNNPTKLFEKNIDVKNSDKDPFPHDSKSRYSEAINTRNTETYKISEHSSESLCRQAKKPDYKNDEENALSFAASSIPLTVSESNKGYMTENKQFNEICHHLESVPLEKNKSVCESDDYEGTKMKSRGLNVRLEDIKYYFTPLPVKELFSTTDNRKESNNVGAEKQTLKRTSPKDQSISSQRDYKKPKSCKIQSKSLHTAYLPVIKDDIVSSLDCRAADNRKESNNVSSEKRTPKRTSPKDKSTSSQSDSKKLKSGKMQPKSLYTTCKPVMKEDIVSNPNFNATCVVTTDNRKESNIIGSEKRTPKRTSPTYQSTSQSDFKRIRSGKIQPKSLRTTYSPAIKENVSSPDFNATCTVAPDNRKESNNVGSEKRTPKRTSPTDQSLSSQSDSKRLKSSKIQPKSLYTTCKPVMKGDFVSTENSQKICTSSDTGSSNEKSSPSSIFQMSQIPQKFNNRGQETSTFNNDEFVFGPRKFVNKGTGENPILSLDSICEGILVAPTIFDRTLAAVKQLNNGNGSTVTEIISNVRRNFPSNDQKLSHDVRKALKNATAAGILTFANGKYKQTPPLIEANTSKKTVKSETNNKILSKRVNPTPTQPRSSRPKTARLTKNSSAPKKKEDSKEE